MSIKQLVIVISLISLLLAGCGGGGEQVWSDLLRSLDWMEPDRYAGRAIARFK